MIEKPIAGTSAVQKEKLERAWDRNLNLRDVLQTVAEERDNLRERNAELLAACKAAKLAVEDYIMRIQKAGFQPSFGNGVLAQIEAAIARATEAE